MSNSIVEVPDSDVVFRDEEFIKNNQDLFIESKRIAEVYPEGLHEMLVPNTVSIDDFGQGRHYECLMPTILSTLIRYPEFIQNVFVTKKVRKDGRYTFRFFKDNKWVPVVIDDQIPMEDGEVIFTRSPTSRWWPLLLEKAYAKFYTTYDHIDGCNVVEVYYDLTGHPSLNVPMDAKLAKAAGADITEGMYWLHVGRRIASGEFVAACLTVGGLESMGIQSEQQYGVLDIFSRTGTSSFEDIVVHLFNPYEDAEYQYTGPLCASDSLWTAAQRTKFDVSNPRSIFLPLPIFLKSMNSLQLCYMNTLNEQASFAFHAEWKGETAGGNPTLSSWRRNPLFSVQNPTNHSIDVVMSIVQPDQRASEAPDASPNYMQCGLVVVRYSYGKPIPSFFVTGNNHKAVRRSLFLNSREVSDMATIPANSLCYIVPCCMHKESEGQFLLRVTALKGADASGLSVERVVLPNLNFEGAIVQPLLLHDHERERVDFYVEDETDVHVLLRQEKPFIGPQGGDAVAQDFMGIYLYDDVNRKIGGVHAATNNRETSILQHLGRPGRFALSITCPRAKGDVPATVTIVTEKKTKTKTVEAPEDAYVFHENEIIDEGNAVDAVNPIDYFPIPRADHTFTEPPDSEKVFIDQHFVEDNQMVTPENWVRIADLYPEGAKQPLVPEKLSVTDFEHGHQNDYGLLSVFASLVDKHADVLRQCFVTQKPRHDGRYAFQFFRYGAWEQVLIDDRIPVLQGKTVYCSSPTRRWWPLLLEKAYAKFYTLYTNMETCPPLETLHDLSGQPCLDTPLFAPFAAQNKCDITDPGFWVGLKKQMDVIAVTATARDAAGVGYGIQPEQTYGVLDFVVKPGAATLDDIIVKMYNPEAAHPYAGPLSDNDVEGQKQHDIATLKKESGCKKVFFVPLRVFSDIFNSFQRLLSTKLLPTRCQNFRSEWGDKTNGGNPTLITWRENPLYMIRNPSLESVPLYASIAQKDQRHRIHSLPDYSVNYTCCGMSLVQSDNGIPTYLVTLNNHQVLAQGLYQNTRDTSNCMVVPPKSLCYLIPSAMLQETCPFLLSYWFEKESLLKQVHVERVNIDVARDLPAMAFIHLRNREKERVDFVVDVPTTVHILLRQEKPFRMDCGGDIMAEDFLALYLFDDQNERLCATEGASNYREIGLVHQLPRAGRYALSITCPRGTDDVPCRIEAVAVKDAHIRITDAPELAPELEEEDVQFFNQPDYLDLVRTTEDKRSPPKLDIFPELLSITQSHEESILTEEQQQESDDRAFLHLPAKTPTPPPQEPAPEEKPKEEEERQPEPEPEPEKEAPPPPPPPKTPSPPPAEEPELQFFRNSEDFRESILPRYINGIPQKTLHLEDDVPFADMERACMEAAKEGNVDRQRDLQEALQKRAMDVANAYREDVREALGVKMGFDITTLPLDNNSEYLALEAELLKLLENPEENMAAITVVQQKMMDVAFGMLMKDLKPFMEGTLDPQQEALLRLDPEFMEMVARRAELIKNGGDEDELGKIEEAMRRRAQELADAKRKKDAAAALKASDREAERMKFLRPIPGVDLRDLPLDTDEKFLKLEAERARLMGLSGDHTAGIKAVEQELNRRAFQLAKELGLLPADAVYVSPIDREAARLKYLRPIPGVDLRDLPLDTDAKFQELEAERTRLVGLRGDHSAEIRAVVEAMNQRALELAKELGLLPADDESLTAAERTAQRLAYLRPIHGVNLGDLPFDTDAKFQELEAERARLLGLSGDHSAEIRAIEEALNRRAFELAKEKGLLPADAKYLSASDREEERRKYLRPLPGVNLSDLPLDTDKQFQELEAERARLLGLSGDHSAEIRAIEEALNRRAFELAKEKGLLPADAKYLSASDREEERRKYLRPLPGVNLRDLPLDTDKQFQELEAERARLLGLSGDHSAEIRAIEEALNRRAFELAKEKGLLPADAKYLSASDREEERRKYLRPLPGVNLRDLPLDTDKQFQELEAERARLLGLSGDHSAEIRAIEEALNRRAFELAKEKGLLPADAKYLSTADLEAARATYLKPIAGVNLRDLPLDTDKAFLELEAERARLLALPGDHTAEIKAVEEALNRRAFELAKENGLLPADAVYATDAEHAASRRKYLRRIPGVDFKDLLLSEDADFRQLEAERERLLGLPGDHTAEIKAIEEAMNRRAFQIAKEMGLLPPDEPYYSADMRARERAEYLLPIPGVDMSALPLDQDEHFQLLENERARLLGLPGDHSNDIRELDDALNRRAWELAQELGLLPKDASYIAQTDLPSRRRRRRPVKDTFGENGGYLYEDIPDPLTLMDQFPCGIPLAHLKDYFDADAEFQHLIQLYYNATNEDEVRDILEAMNRRAREFADAVHDVERADFPSVIDGVLVETLDLNNDKILTDLENRARELRMNPETADPKLLEELEAQILARVRELAKHSRDTYLTEESVGVPIELLDLANYPSFLAKEREMRRLMRNPKANKDAIAYLQELLTEKARERARSILDAHRNYLDPVVDGINTSELPLAQDPDFCRDEAQRALLLSKDPNLYADEIAALEDTLRRRTRRQARQRKAKDLEAVACPDNVPIEFVNPHSDPVFNSFAATLAALKSNPNADPQTIADIEAKLNERVEELAAKVLRGERDLYVPEEVDGVPTSILPLDSDEQFRDLEQERLRVAAAIAATKETRERRQRRLRKPGATDFGAVDGDAAGEQPLESHLGEPQDLYKTGHNPELHPFAQEGRADRPDKKGTEGDEDRLLTSAERDAYARHVQNREGGSPLWGEETPYKRKKDGDNEGPMGSSVERSSPKRAVGGLGESGNIQNGSSGARAGTPVDKDGNPLLTDSTKDAWDRHAGKPSGSNGASGNESGAGSGIPGDQEEQLNISYLKDAYARHVGGVEGDEDAEQNEELILAALDQLIGDRVKELARNRIEEELALLDPEPLGVPVASLHPHNDAVFDEYINAYRNLQEEEDTPENEQRLQGLERLLNDRVYELAQAEVDAAPAAKTTCVTPNISSTPVEKKFTPTEREPQPPLHKSGSSLPTPLLPKQLSKIPTVPVKEVSPVKPIVSCTLPELSSRNASEVGKKSRRVHEVRDKVIKRVVETIENEVPLYEDGEFQRTASASAPEWPHLYEVYPSGYNQPVLPEDANACDVAASPHPLTYLGPFLAALSRVPPLLKRIFQTTTHPGARPYVFNFFNPDSRPVAIKIDDRMPCSGQKEPLFVYSPNNSWWPLLAEKAYAKYVGGYEAFYTCTSNETLRDLTGRPVTHLPLDPQFSSEIIGGNYMSPFFWENIKECLDAGDVYIAASKDECPDGFQPRALFAIFDVIATVPQSKRLEDFVVKVHNCFLEGPVYKGPLNAKDPNWNDRLKRICRFDPEESVSFIYTPLPTFLRNFGSLQHCHINSGDRRTLSGEWNTHTAGGSLKYTTFRQNPLYTLENRSGRAVDVLIELRHEGKPTNKDATYPPTAFAHLHSKSNVACPLVTLNQFNVLQKGLLSDAREVSCMVQLPARSTSVIIPYTKKPNTLGKFKLSLYPQKHQVDIAAAVPIEQTHTATRTTLVVPPASSRGATMDFTVDEPCDVHVLLRQEKHTHRGGKSRGDYLADDDLTLAVYEDSTRLVSSTNGENSNAREIGITFHAPRAGRYTVLVAAPQATSPCPCALTVFTPLPTRFISAPPEGPNTAPPARRWSVADEGTGAYRSLPNMSNNYMVAGPQRPQPKPDDSKPFQRNRGYSV